MLFVPVSVIPSVLNSSCCYLLSDNWDDYTYKTSFVLIYSGHDGSKLQVGGIKITYLGQQAKIQTSFSESFEKLGPKFCSIGSSQDYYEELMTLDADVRKEILDGLSDCVFNKDILHEFANEPAFNKSLLRDTNAQTMLTQYETILSGNVIPSKYLFEYSVSRTS